MRVYSPAKINLHLRVGPIRSDGFHPVVTWMQAVGLFDMLDFSLDSAGRVDLSCSDPALPVDESNLIVRAARLLQSEPARFRGGETPVPSGPHGARISLTKLIPTGGGLGGGSSNAAATLKTLNDLWQLGIKPERLSDLAAGLGSDVPFFLNGPGGICTGRGEIVRKVDSPKLVRWVLLMLPLISMPTPAVYRQFDATPVRDDWSQDVDWKHWCSLGSTELLPRLQNDLEAPAFAICPDLGRLRDASEQLVTRPVRMSGSGSTLFTLYDERDHAESAREKIQQSLSTNTMAVPIVV